MQVREKLGKSRNTVSFQWFVAPEGRKVGSLKRRVRSQLARWEMNNCTPLWREAHFQVKIYKTHHSRTTFGSWDVEKVHAVLREAHFEVKMYKTHQLRTTFGSWDVEKVHAVIRRCGAKHIWKSKCAKHLSVGRLLEVEMSKKCTPLWREAHLEVKMLKPPGVRTTFGSSDVASLRFTTLHCTTLHSTTLQLQLHNYTPLHSTTLNYTTLHYIPLHYTPLRYTTLHYTPLHYNYNYDYTTPLHSTTLNCTTLHYITLHYITFHYTPLHYITLHYITLNDTAPQTDR